MKFTSLFTTIFVLTLVSGCGMGIKHYRHDGPKNIEILSDVNAGENLFVSFSNYFHVYKVKPDCSGIEHLGGYEITGMKSAQLSLPTNELLLIELAFSKNVMRTENLERRDAFIKPKQGESYKFDFYYRKTAIDLKLYKKGKKKDSEIPIIRWSEEACKKII